MGGGSIVSGDRRSGKFSVSRREASGSLVGMEGLRRGEVSSKARKDDISASTAKAFNGFPLGMVYSECTIGRLITISGMDHEIEW